MSGPPRAVSTLARVREVFDGEGFRRFFTARIVSQLGDGIFQLSAAAVLLFETPGTNPALDLLGVSVVTLIPFSAIGPFVGVFIDRWDRRKIITRVPILRAGVAALLPAAALLGKHSVAFYAVVLVVLSSNRFFLATMSAVLPQLVPDDDLLVANSASATGGAVLNVTGQGIGAVLAAVFGGEKAALAAAIAFGASALLARRVPAERGFVPVRAPIGEELRDVFSEMADGIRSVRGAPRVVYGLTAIGIVQFLIGVMVGVLVFHFIAVLHLTVGAAGGILAVLALGIGAGVVFVPLAAGRIRYDLLIPASLLIAAAATAVAAASVNRTTLIVGAGILGISYAFAKIPVDTIVQEEMANAVRGRAFALYDVLFNVARVGGVAVAGLLYDQGATSGSIVAFVSVSYLTAAAAFIVWERREDMRKRSRPPSAASLLQPGEIVTVRAHAGHRADEEPRAIVIGGYEVPVEAIDWRAVVEENGRRSRVFVVRAGGTRIRLANRDDAWEIERIVPIQQPE